MSLSLSLSLSLSVHVCVCLFVCLFEQEQFTQKWKLCDNLLTFMFFQTHLIFTPLEDHISMGLKVLKNNLKCYILLQPYTGTTAVTLNNSLKPTDWL